MAQDYPSPVPDSSYQPEQPKKNNTTLIIIIVVVVVLLCCCCLAAVLAWNYGDIFMNYFNTYNTTGSIFQGLKLLV